MNIKETLTAARDLISDPKNWTQKDAARTSNGMFCSADNPKATCWCAWGALDHVSDYNSIINEKAAQALRNAAYKLFSTYNVAVDVNDRLGHEAVIKVYNQAINDCENC